MADTTGYIEFRVRTTLERYQDAENGICALYGYQDTVPDPDNPGQTKPNPVSRRDFLGQQTLEWWLEKGAAYARHQYIAQAAVQADQLIEATKADARAVTTIEIVDVPASPQEPGA